MNGRSFTVTKSDTTELKDYKRNADNEFDHAQTEERTYTLDQEKYWGRFVDRLDERDSNGEVNVEYVVARQAAEVVAPYLDHLRFDALLGNVSDNVVPANTKTLTILTKPFWMYPKNWMSWMWLKTACCL